MTTSAPPSPSYAPLPFADVDDDPSADAAFALEFTPALATDAPRTLVNSIPLEGSGFVAPFVPCVPEVAAQALRFGCVGPGDVLADFGCGDGRILEAALALPSGAPSLCIGVELDPHLAAHLRDVVAPRFQAAAAAAAAAATTVVAEGSRKQTPATLEVYEGDMFELARNLHHPWRVSAVVLYLLPAGLERLRPHLEDWLAAEEKDDDDDDDDEKDADDDGRLAAAGRKVWKRRRRVVAIQYSVPGWACERAEQHARGWIFYYDLNDVRCAERPFCSEIATAVAVYGRAFWKSALRVIDALVIYASTGECSSTWKP
ncbi:hypothetical protein HK405_012444, partial [Cladochytrium tenue]